MKSLYDEKRLDTFGEPPAPGNNHLRLPTGNEWWQLGIAAAIGLFGVGMSSLSHAVVVIDQSNETLNLPLGGLCSVDSGSHCGQSFKQTNNNIVGGSFYLHPDFFGGSGFLTIGVYDTYTELTGTPSGLLTSGMTLATSPGWVDVVFPQAAVVPGQLYYLMPSTTTAGFTPAVSSYGNSYPDGSIVYYEMYHNGFDLNFRTLAEVPIGGTLPLFGVGMAGLGFIRRKTISAA